MNIINKIKSWLVSDDEILRANGKKSAAQSAGQFVVPSELTSENILTALQQYGREAGFDLNADVEKHKGNALMSSVRNQVIKLHEEILVTNSRTAGTRSSSVPRRCTCMVSASL